MVGVVKSSGFLFLKSTVKLVGKRFFQEHRELLKILTKYSIIKYINFISRP